MQCMRCRCFWAGGGKKQQQEQEQHEKGLSVSVLWKVPTCAKLISLLNARAPFAKRTQDRSGRSGPWSLPWASGLEEGITALHSKGSTPVRGCLANGSLGTDPPFPSPRDPRPKRAQREVKQSTKRGTTLAQRQASRCSTQRRLAFAGLRWRSLRSRFGSVSFFRPDGGD